MAKRKRMSREKFLKEHSKEKSFSFLKDHKFTAVLEDHSCVNVKRSIEIRLKDFKTFLKTLSEKESDIKSNKKSLESAKDELKKLEKDKEILAEKIHTLRCEKEVLKSDLREEKGRNTELDSDRQRAARLQAELDDLKKEKPLAITSVWKDPRIHGKPINPAPKASVIAMHKKKVNT